MRDIYCACVVCVRGGNSSSSSHRYSPHPTFFPVRQSICRLLVFVQPFTLIIILYSQIINIPTAPVKVVILQSILCPNGGQAHAETHKKSISLINLAALPTLI